MRAAPIARRHIHQRLEEAFEQRVRRGGLRRIGRGFSVEEGAADRRAGFGQQLEAGAVLGRIPDRQPDSAIAALGLGQAGEVRLAGQQFQAELGRRAPIAEVVAPDAAAPVAGRGGQRNQQVERGERLQQQAGNLPGGERHRRVVGSAVLGGGRGQPGREQRRVTARGQQDAGKRVRRSVPVHIRQEVGQPGAQGLHRGRVRMGQQPGPASARLGGRFRALGPEEEAVSEPTAVKDERKRGKFWHRYLQIMVYIEKFDTFWFYVAMITAHRFRASDNLRFSQIRLIGVRMSKKGSGRFVRECCKLTNRATLEPERGAGTR